MTAWHGQCLCGAVQIDVRAPAGALIYCHCAQCRKTAGSAFIAVVPVALGDCEISDPQACTRAYSASAGKTRYFCGHCGSPLYSRRDGAMMVRVRAGLFTELPGVTHGGHIFTGDAAPWDTIGGDLPRYAGFEPGR